LAEYYDINCVWREYSNMSEEHPDARRVDETLLPTTLIFPNSPSPRYGIISLNENYIA
jgi:hypothetical protein